MGAIFEVVGGLCIAGALAMFGIVLVVNGGYAVIGAIPMGGPLLLAGLLIAAVGRMVGHLAAIAASSAAQLAILEELRANRSASR